MAEVQFSDSLYEDDTGDEKDEQAERYAKLQKLAMELAKTRQEAIEGRSTSGIEEEWIEDEEYYEGIDDANRHETGGRNTKPNPRSTLGDEHSRGDKKSTIFFNMTRAYVDAASARVADMLLPTDDRGWSIKPTPIPELINIAEARPPKDVRERIKADTAVQGPSAEIIKLGEYARERFPHQLQQQIDQAVQSAQGSEEDAAKKYLELADSVGADMDEAAEKARRAEKRIEDWHVECQYHHQMRMVIEDAARIGTGVLKGPVPVKRRHVAYKHIDENEPESPMDLIIEEITQPASYRVDPWNCFPDPSCGESIHDGSSHWERADITPKKLMDLAMQPGYMPKEIRAAFEEGPHTAGKTWASSKSDHMGLVKRDKSRLFEIWYGYVFLSPDQCEECGLSMGKGNDKEAFLSVAVTMVNNRIIRAVRNHLATGEFPYDYMVWQRRSDQPYGIGVGRQGRAAQRVINAAARNMMDNAGLAGGPMWAFLADVLEPFDGVYEIAPRKGWIINKEVDKDLIQHAFQWFKMDMGREDLQAILEIGLKMFEDVTGLPMILQGQQGSAPDTVGGMQMLSNNASSVMRRIARLFDDLITEPQIRRYYAFLLQYSDNDEEKGDFTIDARGSTALVERDINNQAIFQMAQMVLDPRFGKDPKKWMDQWLRSQKLDPKLYDYDDEEWKQVVEGLAAQAKKGDSSVEVAQIRAEAMAMVQQLRNESEDKDRELETAKLALTEEREATKGVMAAEQSELARQMEIAFNALDKEFESMQLDKEAKARLSETMLKIQAQFMMQDEDQKAAQLTAPAVEPTGRAPEGQAYQK